MVADLRKLTVAQIDYYLREIAKDREEYLSGRGEAPGRWYGRGAELLGLVGLVGDDEFVRMFEGKDPRTGARLGRSHANYTDQRQALPALDLTLRPTKDISLLWAFATPEQRKVIEAAFREAVREAVAYAEASTGTRVGKGGREHVGIEGLMIAGFRHRISRDLDPLLHEHLIIANRAQGPDGRWRTLDSRDLWDARRAIDAAFTGQLEYALGRDLGVRFTPADGHGVRQVVGISEASRRHFSKRSERIEKECELALAQKIAKGARGKLSYHEIKEQVLKTRPAKRYLDMDRLHARWDAEARDVGLGVRDEVAGAFGISTRRLVPVGERNRVYAELAGPHGLTEQASTFTRHDLVQALQARLDGIPFAEVKRIAEAFLEDRGRSLPVDLSQRQPRWTTPYARGLEERLLDLTAPDPQPSDPWRPDLRRPGTPPPARPHPAGRVAHGHVAEALAAYSTLGEDQQDMVLRVLQGGEELVCVVGRPGTGKTYAVNVIRHALERAGIEVAGAAPTGIAADGLQASAGIDNARTIDSLLLSIRRARGRPEGILPRNGVLVIDEAGQIPTPNLVALAGAARATNTRMVLIGDHLQLQSIDVGGGFRALVSRYGAAELTENRRQRDPLDRKVSELFREGQGEQAYRLLLDGGRIRFARGRQALNEAILARWEELRAQGINSVILTPRNEDADRFNRLCRHLRQAAGELGDQELLVGGRRLAVGDRIQCRRNDTRVGVRNRMVGTITAIDPEAGTLTFTAETGREITLPRGYLHARNHHGGPTIDYAYARTGESSEGMTVDGHALIHAIPGRMDQRYQHVVGSRATQRTEWFAEFHPDTDPHRELGSLGPPAETALQRLAADASHARDQILGLDQGQGPDVHTMALGDLRAERQRLETMLAEQAGDPREGRRLQHRLGRAAAEMESAHNQSEQAQTAAEVAARSAAQAPAGWWRRSRARELHVLAEQTAQAATAAREQLGEIQEQHTAAKVTLTRWQAARQHTHPQRQRLGMLDRELADRAAARRQALTIAQPPWLTQALGAYAPVAPAAERRRYQQAAQHLQDYRQQHGISDPKRALGDAPRDGDLARSLTYTRLRREAREIAEITRDPQRHQRGHQQPPALGRQRDHHHGRERAG